jgi:Rod binding domain-containing protein
MQINSRSPAKSLSHFRDLAAPAALQNDPPQLSAEESEAQEVFQKFVAGTFFQEMFKALRKTQGKLHYMDGGKTEEIFRAQFDQQISEDMAKRHGADMCRSMSEPFLQNLRARQMASNQSSSAGQLNRVV